MRLRGTPGGSDPATLHRVNTATTIMEILAAALLTAAAWGTAGWPAAAATLGILLLAGSYLIERPR